ncbi:aminoacyl-tRNA hydrolase [Thermosediminibacter oceani]|uniref:Peptidyl-tRNA hydrolase n=1 Tax=Thermosediminibacter oceani (strain ATCC BAA-1034 / DSM 16646 / JW/IW-1228P) TaxID=555079 RepID=D9RZF0_THEOJ|nr:peptidyl-tRNA hydrolase [Thermosediminibacter oceani DSM 16646]
MFLIVGLGNPGREYEETRHNVGFMVLDSLAAELGIKVDKVKFKGLLGEGVYEGKKLLLLKPMTYMNNSGQSVVEAVKFYKIPPENLVVIYDDMDLPVGRLRVRGSGSSGGQKGMESIIYHIATEGFPRIRIGIGRPKGDVINHVLGRFDKEERKKIDAVIDAAVGAALTIVQHGVQEAMNRYNGFEA